MKVKIIESAALNAFVEKCDLMQSQVYTVIAKNPNPEVVYISNEKECCIGYVREMTNPYELAVCPIVTRGVKYNRHDGAEVVVEVLSYMEDEQIKFVLFNTKHDALTFSKEVDVIAYKELAGDLEKVPQDLLLNGLKIEHFSVYAKVHLVYDQAVAEDSEQYSSFVALPATLGLVAVFEDEASAKELVEASDADLEIVTREIQVDGRENGELRISRMASRVEDDVCFQWVVHFNNQETGAVLTKKAKGANVKVAWSIIESI